MYAYISLGSDKYSSWTDVIENVDLHDIIYSYILGSSLENKGVRWVNNIYRVLAGPGCIMCNQDILTFLFLAADLLGGLVCIMDIQ